MKYDEKIIITKKNGKNVCVASLEPVHAAMKDAERAEREGDEHREPDHDDDRPRHAGLRPSRRRSRRRPAARRLHGADDHRARAGRDEHAGRISGVSSSRWMNPSSMSTASAVPGADAAEQRALDERTGDVEVEVRRAPGTRERRRCGSHRRS